MVNLKTDRHWSVSSQRINRMGVKELAHIMANTPRVQKAPRSGLVQH